MSKKSCPESILGLTNMPENVKNSYKVLLILLALLNDTVGPGVKAFLTS